MQKTELMSLLQSNDQVCTSALIALYHRQTEDEKAAEGTSHRNHAGFGYADCQILSSIAAQAIQNREARKAGQAMYESDLSARQLALVRRLLTKYHRQIVEIYEERTGEPVIDDTPKKAEPETPAETCAPEPEAPAETHAEFARTAPDPQTAREERARREHRAYNWRQTGEEEWTCHSPSGNAYTLTLSSCSCPDATERLQGTSVRCKHRIALEWRLMEEAERTGKATVIRVIPPETADDAALDRVFGRLEVTYHPLNTKPARRRQKAA